MEVGHASQCIVRVFEAGVKRIQANDIA